MTSVANVKRTSGKNMGNVKRENRSLLLTQLFFKGRKSRTSLANELRLTPASITMTINSMIEEGIVVDTDQYELNNRMGRRQQFIDIDYTRIHVVGVTITSKQVRICINDLRFHCIYEDIFTLDDTVAGQYAQIICDKIAFGLYSVGKSKDEIAGIGVTIRGNVDTDKGVSENSFGLLPKHTQIRQDLERRVGLPVSVDNHIRSLMVCEALYSRIYMENSLFIKYGPGISSAVTINGQLYSGGHSMAGEIGHMVLDRGGDLCRCGKRGCLETYSSFRAMKARITQHPCEVLPDLIALLDSQDPQTVEVIASSIHHLLLAISNMAVLFDPKDIILYGELFESSRFLEIFHRKLELETPELTSLLHISAHNILLDSYMAGALAIHAFLESGGSLVPDTKLTTQNP